MHYEITLQSKTTIRPEELHDHISAAELAGVTVRRLLLYWKHGVIKPEMNTGRYGIFFNDEAIYILRRAERLRQDMGLNYSGIRAILVLQKRIEELNEELRFLRS